MIAAELKERIDEHGNHESRHRCLGGSIFRVHASSDADGKAISIVLYRLLEEGEPVRPGELATKVGLDEKLMQEKLRSWAGVFFDKQGRIQGYWGLAIAEMKHRFEVEGRTLYTWCAWDSLFLPEILQTTAQVKEWRNLRLNKTKPRLERRGGGLRHEEAYHHIEGVCRGCPGRC